MFKLACQLLISRKGWLVLITGTLAVILATIISISTASESTKIGIKEQAYLDYGKHTLVLLDNNESKESIYKNKNAKKIGGIKLLGNIEMNGGHSATVGVMDKQAIELGKITLADGSFPQKVNEVAIESSYLSLIDKDWEIGKKKILKINDSELELILSGIIKDYSAKWTVSHDIQKGVNDFPNIVLFNENDLEIEHQNFLVQLKGNDGKVGTMQESASYFLQQHNGFFNERLFFKGLTNYEHITMISFIFQMITILSSFLCMYCLFYFFNITQQSKLAVLRALGSTNQKLFKLNLAQILILLLTGFLMSLPLQFCIYHWLIKNTFNTSHLGSSNLLYVFIIVVLWIVILFCINFISYYLSIRRTKNSSINALLKEPLPNKTHTKKISIQTNEFIVKKVLNQLLTNLKHSWLIIFTVALSILILTFSIYVEKESAGIWDTKVDYYLDSQEVYSFDIVDGLTVLFQEGLTFSPSELKQIENKPGIAYVEKKPFMVDIHPMLEKALVTPSIKAWMNQNNDDILYNKNYIMPNVRYVLVDKDEFNKLYTNLTYEDILNKLILHDPTYTNISDAEQLVGEEISFVQKKKRLSSYETKEWSLEILDVINEPFNLFISDSLHFQYPEFTLVMAEETALEQGLLLGYNQLSIFLEDHISNEKIGEIESELNKLIALTPGSLYQNISNIIWDDQRISVFVGYLGKLTFAISIIISVLNTTVIVFSKYRLMKNEWGIYLSLGMKKKELNQLLFLEMLFYLIIAAVLSLIVFTLTQFFDNFYSYIFYLQYLSISVLMILLSITIGWYVIIRIIRFQSIYSLIREKE